jgi:cytochrome c peroxidase
MKKRFFNKSGWPMRLLSITIICTSLSGGAAWGVVIPPPGFFPLNQVPVPEPRPIFQYIKNKPAAIRLGKALFWDMQTGSDGIQACGSCHFSAGADNRLKNTLNPGLRGGDNAFGNNSLGVPGFPQFAPNYTLQPTDFPFHARQEPVDLQTSLLLRDTNDIVGSQGVRFNDFIDVVPGSRFDNVAPVSDPVFQVNGVNMRRVTARNTPSVINAIFNFTNFWDGRANNNFNGVNPFGPLDQSARIWVNDAGTLVPTQIAIDDASLASQATGPPLDDIEMSARGRTFPKLGRKMMALTPLGIQLVHPGDSVLGALSRADQLPGGSITGAKGLNTTYADMIKAAFLDKYWDSVQPVTLPDGQYSQMEANFSLFWGLAIQLYEATLVSDNTPFDRWVGGDSTALTPQQQLGFSIFNSIGCTVCHAGSELTTASVGTAAFVRNAQNNLIELMTVGAGFQAIYDDGFNNLAVRPTTEDFARGGTAPFTNPMTNLLYPLSFVQLGELWQSGLLPFETPLMPQFLPPTFPVNDKGTFKVPQLRNVELTGPYFHNGSVGLLQNVVDFYARGGNFPINNINDIDPLILGGMTVLQNNPTNEAALIAFLQSLTDERVRNESEPFDHPEIMVPNGAPDVLIRIPAKNALGVAAPTLPTVTLNPVTTPTVQTSQLIGGTKEAGATIQTSVNNGPPAPADTTTDTTWSSTVTGLAGGNNTISVIATDMAGGVTTLTASIFSNAAQLPGAIVINGGAAATSSQSATLTLSASGTNPITQMQFSKDGVNFFAYEPYATTRVVTLLPGEGLKTIYVRFKDSLGNVSQIFSDSIFIDTTPPTGTVTIKGGAAVTNSLSAPLTLTASDPYGVTSMQFSKDGVNYFPWEPFAATRTVTLPAVDGTKTIYVKFRDSNGNVSPPISDTITLDTTVPTGTIQINGGAATTTSTAATLTLSATDANGVAQMQFSKDGGINWFPFETFAATRNVTLTPAGPGVKTVNVRYRDAAGNVSASLQASITLQ